VHRYPSAVKAFYMKPDPGRADVALCVDVLAPEGYGEIIGGGQRLDDYDLLLQRIKDHNLPQEAFEWYLDLRRYGSVPHGGFGMGIERVVTWICGIDHLRRPFLRMHRSTRKSASCPRRPKNPSTAKSVGIAQQPDTRSMRRVGADVLIVNTCAFINSRSRNHRRILEMAGQKGDGVCAWW
jgi:hypothetical protein